jgi:hypothetical protein
MNGGMQGIADPACRLISMRCIDSPAWNHESKITSFRKRSAGRRYKWEKGFVEAIPLTQVDAKEKLFRTRNLLLR